MKVEQAKRCFLCRYNRRAGGEWDSGLAETSGVEAAAQHNPPSYGEIDLIGTIGCGIKCLSATRWHGGSRTSRPCPRRSGARV